MDAHDKKQIGQILLEKNYLTKAQLEHGLREQQKGKNQMLGQVLLDFGYIIQDQLDEVLALKV